MNDYTFIAGQQNFSQLPLYKGGKAISPSFFKGRRRGFLKTKIVSTVIFVFYLACFCLSIKTSLADEKGGEDIVALVQQKYKNVNSVEADFVQTNYIASLNQAREFRGKIFLKKPNFFNMEVSHPAQQRQTVDGHYLWIYTPANNQVLKDMVSSDFLRHPFLNLLSTMENLDRDFFISVCEGGVASDPSLKLTLKEKYSELREVLITVARNTYQIKELTIYYESGNYTRLALSKIKENQKISPQRFHFTPPAGVEVVEPPVYQQNNK